MPRSIFVTLVLLSAAILPLCAQDTDASDARKLAPGTRVRLTVDSGGDSTRTIKPGRYVGMLRAVGSDSVQVQYVGADAPETLPWTVVSRIEVSRGVNKPLKIIAISVGAVGGACRIAPGEVLVARCLEHGLLGAIGQSVQGEMLAAPGEGAMRARALHHKAVEGRIHAEGKAGNGDARPVQRHAGHGELLPARPHAVGQRR